MTSLKTIGSRHTPVFLLLAALSCTIVQDGDITSSAELLDVKLSAIDISQDTNTGKNSVHVKLNYDSVQNFVDQSTGTKITRKIDYSLPALGSLKLKLRSGTTNATHFYIYYTESKQPYTMAIMDKDSVVELYRFRYSNTGQLNKIVSILNPVDKKPPTVRTNDSLLYSGTLISSVIRKSSDGVSKTGTINIQYNGGSGNVIQGITNFTFGYQYNQRDDNCNGNHSYNTCTGYAASTTGTGSGQGTTDAVYTATYSQTGTSLNQIVLTDNKLNSSSRRDYDTYYFHPMMVLRNQTYSGNYLYIIYMIDWWLPGPVLTTTNFTRNEFVTFSYGYSR